RRERPVRAGEVRDGSGRGELPRLRDQGRARAVVDRVPRRDRHQQPVPAHAQRGQLPGQRRDRRRHQLRRLLLSGGARALRGSAMNGMREIGLAAMALALAVAACGSSPGGSSGTGGGGAGTSGAAGSAGAAGGTGTITKMLDIADVWSGHPVGFALVTTGTRQYAAYYDVDRTMTVASRALTSDTWTFARLPSTVGWDSHNYTAMDVD